jgi:hypothetical protein
MIICNYFKLNVADMVSAISVPRIILNSTIFVLSAWRELLLVFYTKIVKNKNFAQIIDLL